MSFRSDIDVGTIILIITLLISVVAAHFTIRGMISVIVARFDDFKKTVEDGLTTINKRLDRHEEVIMTMTGTVQRIVGKLGEVPERRDGS